MYGFLSLNVAVNTLNILRPAREVGAPSGDHSTHVIRQGGIELHPLPGIGMGKSQLFRMEGLSGQNLEAIFHELPVFGKGSPLQDLATSIIGIIEQRMSDMLHVNPDLVGPASLKPAFNQGDIPQLLQYFIMGNGSFPL